MASPVSRATLSDYTIVLANDDQVTQHARAAHTVWGKGKPFEDFLQVSLTERKLSWGRDGGLLVWVLVKRDDLQGEMYSGCEVYRRKALLKRKGSGEIEEKWTYGVASVVTPIKHLKHGFATHLLRLLHYQLAEPTHLPSFPTAWGAPPPPLSSSLAAQVPKAISSILFSDVGASFYSKCTIGLDTPGWVVGPTLCNELVWKILPTPTKAAESSRTEDAQYPWEPLADAEMVHVGNVLSESARKEFPESNTASCSKTIFRPDPASTGTLSFLPIKGPLLGDQKPPPGVPYGLRIRAKTGHERDDTIVLFTAYNANVTPARLLITYAHNLRAEHIPSLLPLLDGYAAETGRTEGWIWGLDLSSELVGGWKGVESREVRCGKRKGRDSHLVAVAWYGPEEEEEVEYVDSQLWTWC